MRTEYTVIEQLVNGDTMKVEVKLYATLARYVPPGVTGAGGIVDVAEGMTVAELIQQWCIPEDQVKLIFVDGVHATRETVLTAGSRLGIFPPVGGG